MLVGAYLKGKVLVGNFSEYCELWCTLMSKLEKTIRDPSLRGGGCGWWVVATLQVWTLLPARGSAPSVARLGAQPRPEVDSILLHNLGPVTASTPSSQPQHTPVSTLSSQLPVSLCRALCSVTLLRSLLPTLRGGMRAVSSGAKHSKPLHGTAHQFCIIIRSKKLHFVQQFCVPKLLIMYS